MHHYSRSWGGMVQRGGAKTFLFVSKLDNSIVSISSHPMTTTKLKRLLILIRSGLIALMRSSEGQITSLFFFLNNSIWFIFTSSVTTIKSTSGGNWILKFKTEVWIVVHSVGNTQFVFFYLCESTSLVELRGWLIVIKNIYENLI